MLIVHKQVRDTACEQLIARFAAAGTKVVLLGESLDDDSVLELLRRAPIDHVISETQDPEAPELAVTATKLRTGQLFGLDKYLQPGTFLHERTVTGYDDKRVALGELAEFSVISGLRRQTLARVESVSDELLMNALYDAPTARRAPTTQRSSGEVPAQARPTPSPTVPPPAGPAAVRADPLAALRPKQDSLSGLRSKTDSLPNLRAKPDSIPGLRSKPDALAGVRPRTDSLPNLGSLHTAGESSGSASSSSSSSGRPTNSTAHLTYGSDGRFLGVSVRDDFGTLHRAAILEHLLRARTQLGAPVEGTAGAGLGLYFILASVTHFIANIDPGHTTEVICLFDCLAIGKNRSRYAKSLHLFTRSG